MGMKVLSVASEIYPLVKTGGLADVAGALPLALSKRGIEVKTLVPGYPAVMAVLRDVGIRMSSRTFWARAPIFWRRELQSRSSGSGLPCPFRPGGRPLSRHAWT